PGPASARTRACRAPAKTPIQMVMVLLRDARCRRRLRGDGPVRHGQGRQQRHFGGTLMRHFLAQRLGLTLPVRTLPVGITAPTLARLAEHPPSFPQAPSTSRASTGAAAVALPAITSRAQEEHLAACCPATDHTAKRFHVPGCDCRKLDLSGPGCD